MLICWVLGQSTSPFLVRIGGDEIMDDLNKKIKKRNKIMFAGIDASALDVWKVGESPSAGLMTSDILEAI